MRGESLPGDAVRRTSRRLDREPPVARPVSGSARGDLLERDADAFAARVSAPPTTFGPHAPPSAPGSLAPSPVRFPDDGEPLSAGTRGRFERHLGLDLSGVRLHDLPPGLERSAGPRAFTIGSNVALAGGPRAAARPAMARTVAHEIAHVVQQVGPGAAAKEPVVQADGELTDEDLAVIRQWLAEDPAGSGPLEGPPGLASGQLRLPEFPSRDIRFGTRPPPGYVCPGSCHQSPQEMWEAQQRREAERREAAKRAAWQGMHAAQAEAELRQQTGSLQEDIAAGRGAVAKVRLQLFDLALHGRTARTPAGGTTLTPHMRDSWFQAEQAALVIDATLRAAGSAPLPPEVANRLRSIFVGYYAAVSGLMRNVDAGERRAVANARQTARNLCPGSCHQPAPPRPQPSFGLGSPPDLGVGRFPGLSAPRPATQAAPETSPDAPASPGPRESRLDAAVATVLAAVSAANWRSVLNDHRWVTSELDSVLRAAVTGTTHGDELLAQLEFASQLLARQERLRDQYPDALKVQAVFFPKERFTTRTDAQGVPVEVAEAIPWQFYLTRTPVADPSHVLAGFEWQLHDLTAPRRDDRTVRTVRTRYQVGAFEALARERGPWRDPLPILQMDPPRTLFEQLNKRDFFPEGHLYWRQPLSGKPDSMRMTAPKPFLEWLELIGMAVVLIGSFVFAPYSTPMLVSVLAGTGLTIGAKALRLREKREHGVLEPGEVERFYWSLALDIVNVVTLGLGRAAIVAAEAENLVRATSLARSWYVLRTVEHGMQGINLLVVTNDLVKQYQAIKRAKLPPDQERKALVELTMHATLAGVLSIVQLRAAQSDLRGNPTVVVGVDPGDPTRLVARLEVLPVERTNLSATAGLTSEQLARRPRALRGEFEAAQAAPRRRFIQDEVYDQEVILGNGHVWRRRKAGGWCRHSDDPLCFIFGEGPGRRGSHIETFPPERKARKGIWSGTPGNSEFTPNRADALQRANFQPIPYRNGYPDFTQFAEATVLLPRAQLAIRDRDLHNLLADTQLARQRGWRLPNGEPDVAQATALRTNPNDPMTWHHVEGDNILLLVPRPIHKAAQHAGGFSLPALP